MGEEYDFMENEYEQDQEVLKKMRRKKKDFSDVINKKDISEYELDEVMA